MTCQCICRLYALVVGEARRLDSSACPRRDMRGNLEKVSKPLKTTRSHRQSYGARARKRTAGAVPRKSIR